MKDSLSTKSRKLAEIRYETLAGSKKRRSVQIRDGRATPMKGSSSPEKAGQRMLKSLKKSRSVRIQSSYAVPDFFVTFRIFSPSSGLLVHFRFSARRLQQLQERRWDKRRKLAKRSTSQVLPAVTNDFLFRLLAFKPFLFMPNDGPEGYSL